MVDAVSRHVLVSGRVQGVWFRHHTGQTAARLGVAGWVRNLPDGRVEAVFEGPADAVAAAVAWCREGPELAAVAGVEVQDQEPLSLTGFEVRG